jgi:hypothetical protein
MISPVQAVDDIGTGVTMSDMSQGPGWWRASDDRWYAPERHPDYVAPPAPTSTPPGPTGGLPHFMTGMVTAPTDDGSRVLTMDPEMPMEPVWRAGSKRQSMGGSASSSYSSDSLTGVASGAALSRQTVSSRVPALRVFTYLGIGWGTFRLLTYLALRADFESSVGFVARTSGTAHNLIVLSYLVQGLGVLDLMVFLALLLSRSFQTVRALMALVVGWSLLSVVLGVVLRSPFLTGSALVTALYVGFVFSRVGQARAAESFSERDGAGTGYSSIEKALAGYVVLITIATTLVTFNLYSATSPSSSAPGIITYANGQTSPPAPGVDSPPTAYVQQTVSAHDFKVSLNFDPNSTAHIVYYAPHAVGGSTTRGFDGVGIGGNLLNTSTQILISVDREGASGAITADCPTPGAAGAAPTLSFTATIMGQPTTICGPFEGVDTSFNAGAYQYHLSFTLPVQLGTPTPATSAALQSIASSIKVQ